MKDPVLYVVHMQECIARIQEYTASGREFFFGDPKTQDAVLRNLQTLSESTQRLPDSMKSTHDDIPWRSIAAFRNVLVHDYLGVDLNEIWDIVIRDIPRLEATVSRMLREAVRAEPPNRIGKPSG